MLMSVGDICPKAEPGRVRFEGKFRPIPPPHYIFRGRCGSCGVWEYRCVMCSARFYRRYKARHVEPTCSPRCRKRLQRARTPEKVTVSGS